MTKHGKAAVIVLAAEEYERLAKAMRSKGRLVQFLAKSPLARAGVRLEGGREYSRSTDVSPCLKRR
jgi:hypothetical protein